MLASQSHYHSLQEMFMGRVQGPGVQARESSMAIGALECQTTSCAGIRSLSSQHQTLRQRRMTAGTCGSSDTIDGSGRAE